MLGPLLDVNGSNGVLVSLVAIGAVRSLMVIRFTVGDSVWLRGDGKIYDSVTASSKYEVGAESWAAREPSRAQRGVVLPGSAYPGEGSATGLPERGADQRCDGDEDEHCAMIACVEVVVVSFGIVRHVPEPRFTYWPASL